MSQGRDHQANGANANARSQLDTNSTTATSTSITASYNGGFGTNTSDDHDDFSLLYYDSDSCFSDEEEENNTGDDEKYVEKYVELKLAVEIAEFKAKKPEFHDKPLPSSVMATLEAMARFHASLGPDEEVKPCNTPRARYPSGDLTRIKEEQESKQEAVNKIDYRGEGTEKTTLEGHDIDAGNKRDAP